jgi:replicative superfamily II helicase
LINAVVSLANETARAGYGALVFGSSRTGCEKNAVSISQALPQADEVNSVVMARRRDILNSLRSTATGLDHVLERTIPLGVAFHRKFWQLRDHQMILKI